MYNLTITVILFDFSVLIVICTVVGESRLVQMVSIIDSDIRITMSNYA